MSDTWRDAYAGEEIHAVKRDGLLHNWAILSCRPMFSKNSGRCMNGNAGTMAGKLVSLNKEGILWKS
ncbi:MAG: hypothetical protein A3E07_02525 [Candidatus Wildermuthbacteria bacterium RIFCSPHIGHO2_12_FULL_45_9]|uniref:Uncharacterized protein n=1 Tax=Candidatus Wildermuthbacteria bacterium RIFCSPHIGHO2_02_FULL_45_25 TaxID=1802450 RepID=A0A1G2R4N1_9BACT|nr:MAG: hypothetical protein A2748_01710 [Candidatus Wildermuthbacteria bacterium RIFCSPHIGHO2_01_FULL_45_20]OHA67820.1 MAG: hypothetical protein A3C04_04235 [Candidatus Wildermuthbacteria bacterium RIFCSPHIGHO2_02_FULL_45_25]OHA71826.1 MAG: hypothetical protein A3E07_02525 [Candidatus Wildermuthbacteria bacterium RIFCSPHIGHO2_12_FULL_45_9]